MISWPRNLSDEALASRDSTGNRIQRHMPVSCIGYGAAGVVAKTANLVHKLMLECGNAAKFHQERHAVRGITTDQGVEASMADIWGRHFSRGRRSRKQR